ncbi:hypothetical protein COL154_010595 [Colletotrichum chrysophilum]|nr:hypothetical protein COL154_010595 [Colletotrichum chrysophilum]
MRTRHHLTSVVHQVIQAAVLPLDELKDAGDRFIAVDVDLDDFEGARRGGDVVAELRGGGRALLRRSGSEKNVVLCVGGEERFDGLVADAGVGAFSRVKAAVALLCCSRITVKE